LLSKSPAGYTAACLQWYTNKTADKGKMNDK